MVGNLINIGTCIIIVFISRFMYTEGRDANPAKKLVISKINFEICMLQRNRSWKDLNFCLKIYNDGFVQQKNTDGPQIDSAKVTIILRILFMYNYLDFFNKCWKLNPNFFSWYYFLNYNLQIMSNFEAIAAPAIMCLQKHQNHCRISLPYLHVTSLPNPLFDSS
jgi:hypothetical protein